MTPVMRDAIELIFYVTVKEYGLSFVVFCYDLIPGDST